MWIGADAPLATRASLDQRLYNLCLYRSGEGLFLNVTVHLRPVGTPLCRFCPEKKSHEGVRTEPGD